jgi:mono/diheme cytochrome c family protein
MNPLRLTLFIGAVAFAASAYAAESRPTAEQLTFFENKIRPLLADNCLECHSAAKRKTKGGLSMDNREDMRRGGDNGAIVVPGNPTDSTMVAAVEWRGDTQMPPKKHLRAEQIADLKKWIVMGAPDPREKDANAIHTAPDHWSFKPVTAAPPVPSVKDKSWVKTPVDAFVLAKLEEKNMQPAALPNTGTPDEMRKKKESLLRRAYFDLIGLPPSPEQIRAFIADASPNAFEKVIDSLLKNPHYGERWARHWMDTARYSDTGGVPERGFDQRFPYAWGYRDWLIRVTNDDMPYDQFIMHQLAADQLSAKPDANWAALAFITIGQSSSNPDEIINERIDSVGRGFLGLTLACARCHDHKFDPITQADYYALHGVFRSTTQPTEGPIIGASADVREFQAHQTKLRELQDHAWAAYLHIAKRENARMRSKAAAYFRWGIARIKNVETDEERKALEALKVELKLEGDDTYWLRGEFAPNFKFNGRDPIFGPFVALGEGNRKYFDEIMSGKRMGYNPIVIAFFKSQKTLPRDAEETAQLFDRFWSETITPVAGKPVDPKCLDFVSEIKSGGGVTTKIWNLRDKIVGHAELPLMELAVYPWRLIAPELPMRAPTHCKPDDSIELKLLEECRGHDARGSELETAGRVNGINMFKLTSPAGPMRAMVVEDLPQPVDSPIYPRGNKPLSGDPAAKRLVPRRYIEALSPGGGKPFVHGSGRLELAQAIANKSNPLTARVAVNRVWMQLFGEGLIRTPDDLGSRAGQPSHPELFDYLAWWFMQEMPGKRAWTMKPLHKLIMLSAAYQQSALTPHLAEYQKLDPGNLLLWRANIRRLDFEAFRDSMLTMAGALDGSRYGPPVNLVSEPYSQRRSIYGYIDRANVPELLTQFDFANPTEPNTRRTSTIVPQQSLFLMNSPFTIGIVRRIMARDEVKNALATHHQDDGFRAVYRVVLQRTPTPIELEKAATFLKIETARQADCEKEQRTLLAKAQQRAEEILESEKSKNSIAARAAVVNAGDLVERTALTPWETLVQALLFSNEAAYLN